MNKKLLLFVPMLALLISGCGQNEPTSESSTSEPSTSIPSEDIPKEFDLDTIFGQVGYSLNKYNPYVDTRYMAYNSSLLGKSTITQKELLSVARKALIDKMPEVKGARRYQGDFKPSNPTRNLTAQEAADMNFFKTYGLISGDYDPDMVLDLAAVKISLARIHQYFGTNQNDDFASTVMSDWLYDHDSNEGRTQDDDIYDSTVVSSENMYVNANTLCRESFDDPEYASLENVYKVFTGETPFYFESKTSKFNEDLTYIESNVVDYASIISTEAYLMHEGLSCSFARSPDIETEYDDVSQEYKFLWTISSDPLSTFSKLYKDYYDPIENDFDIDSFWSNNSYNYMAYSMMIGSYSSIATSTIATNYKLFLQKLDDILNDSPYSASQLSATRLVNDYDAFNVLTSTPDAVPSYKSYFAAEGIDTTNAVYGGVNNLLNSLLGRFLELAKTDTSLIPLYKSFAYYSYFSRNIELIAIAQNNGTITNSSLLKIVGYPLTAYFQTTDNYTAAKTKVRDVFDKLIYSLKANATSNGWLTTNGVAALSEKADLVTAALFASYEGTDYDYASFYKNIPFTSDIALDYMLMMKAKIQMYANWASSGKSLAYAATVLMDPFTPNAFYFPITNSITITMGYLASIDFDLSSLSNEELMATFGLVVGHEITHGFDSNGCYYDGHGMVRPNTIFPAEDLATFQAKQEDVKKLYTLEVMPGVMQSGTVTLSEDLADLGGMSLVHRIAKDNYDDFDYREFYTQVAKHFMAKVSRNRYINGGLATDVHALGKARCNPLLMNCPKFIEVFGIKKGDGMYRDPNQHIVIW